MSVRFIRILVVVCALVCGAWPAFAQSTGSISGTVVDAVTGAPIQNIFVELFRPGGSTSASFTQASGAFGFSSLPPGTYYLTTDDSNNRYPDAIYGTPCFRYRCAPQQGAPIQVSPGQAITGIVIRLFPGARVEGRLLDALSLAPSSAFGEVQLHDADGYRVQSSFSSASTYTLTNVPPGNYYLVALITPTSEGFISEISDGRHCGTTCSVLGGTPFAVLSSTVVSKDFMLDRGGKITGRVTDGATGATLSVSSIEAESLDGNRRIQGSSVFNNPLISYEITGIPPGRYVVRARANTPYVSELYPNVPAHCLETSPACSQLKRLAVPIEVTAGSTVPGIDIALSTGGTIAGGLTVDGSFSGSATVWVLSSTGVEIARTFTSAPGGYASPTLPPGRYYLCVTGSGFMTQAYGGLRFPSAFCPSGSGTPVDVTAGGRTGAIDFALRAVTSSSTSASISGTVRSGGTAVGNFGMAVYRAGFRLTSSFSFDSSGRYSVTGLQPGTYQLRTEMLNNFVDEWFGGTCVVCSASQGTPIIVGAGVALTGIDFDLSPGGAITGSAPGASEVAAYDASGRRLRNQSGIGGTYTINGLPTGSYYVIARPPTFPSQIDIIYPNVPCIVGNCPVLAGTAVQVTTGAVTSNINFSFPTVGRIAGRIVAEGFRVDPLSGDFPSFKAQAYDAQGKPVGVFASLANGLYEIRGLSTGTYYVRTIDAQSAGFADQLYRDVECAGCPVTRGTAIHVVEGETTPGIDFELKMLGTITGSVVDASTLAPLENITVQARSLAGAVVGNGLTTRDGSFVIRGLPDGGYHLATQSDLPYQDQLPPTGGVINVSGGLALPVNVQLQPGGRIAGTVTGEAGKPSAGAIISVLDHTGAVVTKKAADDRGGYLVKTPPGTFYVRADAVDGALSQIYDRATCPNGICDPALATLVFSPALGLATGIDFPLTSCLAGGILPPALSATKVGRSYSVTFARTSGLGPHRSSVLAGTVPPGLALNSTSGTLSGIVTTAGDYQFTVGMTDTSGCVSAQSYSLIVDDCSVTPDRTQASFGAAGGQVVIGVASGCEWTAISSDDWMAISSITAGPGGSFTMTIPANTGAIRHGYVWVGDRVISVAQAAPTTTPPFGSFDIPGDNSTVSGSIALGGWALDDVSVTRVQIYRDPVGGEPPGFLVFLGDAVRVPGARPDIEAAFFDWPYAEQAGWGYLLLTNVLANQGNGPFRVHVFAEDIEGNTVLLGSRNIIAANATSTSPFGAVDAPGQGETISGTSYTSFGWALTPQPKSLTLDGSAITLMIDGVPSGFVGYGYLRLDVAALFPGLNNTNTAGAQRMIDTTSLTDGLHTMAWSVRDSAGVVAGIGSRYFNVDNGVAFVAAPPGEAVAMREFDAPVAVQTEEPRHIRIREMQPFAIDLAKEAKIEAGCAATFSGAAVTNGKQRPLPVGSALDPATGRFTWLPGPGFVGSYDLVFAITSCDGRKTFVPYNVQILRTSRE